MSPKKKSTARKSAPAKKKSAAKKTAPKKAAAKKTTTPKKTAAKKTSSTKKTASSKKKAAASKKKGSSTKSGTKNATSGKAATKSAKTASKSKEPVEPAKKTKKTKKTDKASEEQAEKLMLSARTRKHTPTIFKIKSRKNTPIVFTLDDVRELIETKKKEKKDEEAAPKKTAARQKEEKEAEQPVQHQAHKSASLADILGFNPNSKQTSPSQRDDSQVPKKWQKFYKELIGLRQHVQDELDFHTADTLKRSNKEDSGDLSGYGQHMADAGTDSFDRDFALSLVSSEQEALYEIEQAIDRIFKGTYGTCEITGDAIPKDRLMAVPFTRYSLEGQRQLESTRRTRGRNVSGNVFAEASDEDAATLAEDDDS